MKRILAVIVPALAVAVGACSGGDVAKDGFKPAAGGEERTVLVDFGHDEFASAFLRYYPAEVKVRPGDVVTFRQSWTGEPHSVTLGRVVDDILEYGEIFEKYESEEAARADGVSDDVIDKVNAAFNKFPSMVGDGYNLFEPGAQPCFIPTLEEVPAFNEGDAHVEGVTCPTAGKPQPEFTGRQGLYNSGFIAPDGDRANTFQVPIAADAVPGTYQYFCNYHWIAMGGTIEIVGRGAKIPPQRDVNRQARSEIDEDAKAALARVREARAVAVGEKVGDLTLPLAGREADDEFAVIINEFLPKKVKVRAGTPVTWTFDGIAHTVSFNVPKYFPIFSKRDSGTVVWEPKSYEPAGWDVPVEPPDFSEVDPAPRTIDVGRWDGRGGYHSSGALESGDTFTVTLTKPGTYPFACVLHPQMVGTLEVT